MDSTKMPSSVNPNQANNTPPKWLSILGTLQHMLPAALIGKVDRWNFTSYTGIMCLFGLLTLLRSYINGLESWIQRYYTSTIYAKRSSETYDMLLSWIKSHGHGHNARSSIARIQTNDDGDKDNIDMDKSLRFDPWNGQFQFWFKRNWITYRSELRDDGFHKEEVLSISCSGRCSNVLKELIKEARKEYLSKNKKKTTIFENYGDNWRKTKTIPIRPLSSVILGDEQPGLVDNAKGFADAQTHKWYTDRHIPYRRGYLLYGPPGTGKTCFCLSIAGELSRDIYTVNLTTVNDRTLQHLFNNLPGRCIVLFEDIDAMSARRFTNFNTSDTGSSESDKRVSLSGLLNVIDGVASPEGRILIMTTNYPEKLDDALIRPGRIDIKSEFQLANSRMVVQAFDFVYNNGSHVKRASEFALKVPEGEFSMAEIFSYLISHKDSMDDAFQSVDEWVVSTRREKRAASALINDAYKNRSSQGHETPTVTDERIRMRSAERYMNLRKTYPIIPTPPPSQDETPESPLSMVCPSPQRPGVQYNILPNSPTGSCEGLFQIPLSNMKDSNTIGNNGADDLQRGLRQILKMWEERQHKRATELNTDQATVDRVTARVPCAINNADIEVDSDGGSLGAEMSIGGRNSELQSHPANTEDTTYAADDELKDTVHQVISMDDLQPTNGWDSWRFKSPSPTRSDRPTPAHPCCDRPPHGGIATPNDEEDDVGIYISNSTLAAPTPPASQDTAPGSPLPNAYASPVQSEGLCTIVPNSPTCSCGLFHAANHNTGQFVASQSTRRASGATSNTNITNFDVEYNRSIYVTQPAVAASPAPGPERSASPVSLSRNKDYIDTPDLDVDSDGCLNVVPFKQSFTKSPTSESTSAFTNDTKYEADVEFEQTNFKMTPMGDPNPQDMYWWVYEPCNKERTDTQDLDPDSNSPSNIVPFKRSVTKSTLYDNKCATTGGTSWNGEEEPQNAEYQTNLQTEFNRVEGVDSYLVGQSRDTAQSADGKYLELNSQFGPSLEQMVPSDEARFESTITSEVDGSRLPNADMPIGDPSSESSVESSSRESIDAIVDIAYGSDEEPEETSFQVISMNDIHFTDRWHLELPPTRGNTPIPVPNDYDQAYSAEGGIVTVSGEDSKETVRIFLSNDIQINPQVTPTRTPSTVSLEDAEYNTGAGRSQQDSLAHIPLMKRWEFDGSQTRAPSPTNDEAVNEIANPGTRGFDLDLLSENDLWSASSVDEAGVEARFESGKR